MGVSTEFPANTMPAFIAAAEQGYSVIELDVSATKDLLFVLLHDSTLNRTARTKDGEPLPETVNISDITFKEALEYDFGVAFSKKFKGTKIPLLEDVMIFARKNGISLKIDNKYQFFNAEQREAFFKLLKSYQDVACLTCYDADELETVSKLFPEMSFHYDGPVTTEILSRISGFLPKERLTVWLPLKCKNTSWVRVEFADETLANTVKQYARLGLWILSTGDQLKDAERLGAEIVETNGQLKPKRNEGLVADMHTHSENSHDSSCKIADMLASQLDKGTKIFAVTDHVDTDSYTDYDVFTPIAKANETAAELTKLGNGGYTVLGGVEISEGFWHPEVCEKVSKLCDYDVVIGSVHLVKSRFFTYAYSKCDFSQLDIDTVANYVDEYFDDVLTMLDNLDFDILAHLTCPIRYINGKYKLGLGFDRYKEKIEKILSIIIKQGIALEVNTSSYGMIDDFMPSKDILKKYKEMGGYLITVGSDAHTSKNASKYFDEALGTLRELGFENIFYYKKRKPYQITI